MRTENNTLTLNVVTGNKAVKLTPNADGFARIDSLVGNMSKRHITVEIMEKAVCVWNFVNKTEFGACIEEGIKSLNYDEKIIISNSYKLYKTDSDALETGKETPQEELFVRALTEEEISSNRYEYRGHIYKIVAEDDDTPDGDDTVTDAENKKDACQSDIGKDKIEVINRALSRIETEKSLEFGSIAEYKKHNNVDENTTNWFIHSIKQVKQETDHYDVLFNNNTSWKLYFDGFTIQYNKDGSRKSSSIKTDGKEHKRVRITITVANKLRSLPYERAIAICKSFVEDIIPLNIHDAEANMINSSANSNRAERLGIKKWDFRPEYIEWTTSPRNKAHSVMVDLIYMITGKCELLSGYSKIFDRDEFSKMIQPYLYKTS